jgi:hypothetical protein
VDRPPDRAVYLPAGLEHAIDIRGDVDMRTVYVSSGIDPRLPAHATVLEVGPLLRALILALIEEPVLCDEDDRGGAIARLIPSEITRARALPPRVPMPAEGRDGTSWVGGLWCPPISACSICRPIRRS